MNDENQGSPSADAWCHSLFAAGSGAHPSRVASAPAGHDTGSKGRPGELWQTRLFEGRRPNALSSDKMLISKNGVAVSEISLDDLGSATLIGRHPSAAIQLESYRLAMFHARLLREGGRYFIESLDYDSGTLIGRRKLKTKCPVLLRDGCVVDIPGYQLQFSLPGSSAEEDQDGTAIEGEELESIPDFFYQPPAPTPPACPLLSHLVDDHEKIEMWRDGVVELTVADIVEETPDVKTFRLAGASPLFFSYRPGQFVTFLLDIDGREVQRSYSMSSSPSRPHVLEVTVKRVPGGLVSNWLCDNLKLGDGLKVKGPAGKFSCFDFPSRKMLFIGAGSGITPIMSMSRWIADTAAGVDVKLLASFRSPPDIIFRKELELMSARHSGFHVAVTMTSSWHGTDCWTGFTGRIDRRMVEMLAPDYQERHVFMCGPEPFMASVKEVLRDMDFDMAKLHSESFGGVRVAKGIEQGLGALALKGPLHKVTFTKSGVTVDTDEHVSLLELAEAHGIEIDYSCRSGSCGVCEAKCQGVVELGSECSIDKKDREAGFVYTCCAIAKSNLAVDY